ncbi:MAG: DNA translocase FtsK [Alphaproteobacteria bacterium]|nr:DNA translocase FtsK [Alphaproteobacteria bacterium]MDA8004843.1 DNA translocase FtsK [Alphaproteobacteria bacterium]MDA8006503.1 DNA translocase FtsK [Alphaproteobacteria bacterium]MDA8013959.1 DNA translocase FtsK [Alphaproteobacteria bacterium]
MPRNKRKTQRSHKQENSRRTFLPPRLRSALRQLALQLLGVAWIITAAAIATALWTYNPDDPSLNVSPVDGRETTNALGVIGSYPADLLIQGFGRALAWLAAAAPLAFGLRLVLCHPVGRAGLRLPALVAGAALAALALPAADPESGRLASLADGGWIGGTMNTLETTLANTITDLVASEAWLPWLMWLPAWGLRTLAAIAAFTLVTWSLTLPPFKSLRFAVVAAWKVAKFSAAWTWRGLRMLVGKPAPPREPSEVNVAALRARLVALLSRMRGGVAAPFTLIPNLLRGRKLGGKFGGKFGDSRIEPSLGGKGGGVVVPADTATPATTRARANVIHVDAETPVSAGGKTSKRAAGGGFSLPGLDLLSVTKHEDSGAPDRDTIRRNTEDLERVLREFGIQGEIVRTRSGPIVTRYELAPAPGIKTGRVVSLADDIARSMSAVAARIAVVPGESTIGIELPNKARGIVGLRELLDTEAYADGGEGLPIALGVEISGKPVILDLARMPHLLVAGTTGSGKSVALQGMLLSLLYRLPPSACKLIMVDPKMLELNVYDGIPHLITPVVTEPKKAIVALKWAVREMETRNRAMSRLGARNLTSYNERLEELRRNGEAGGHVQTGYDPETGRPVYEERGEDLSPLPYIVIVVDEMADLMMVAGKEVEGAVQRLSQMARAAGIHLIMATQRPSVDVITGTVKANFPSRLSFQVTSKVDSRTILGEGGAEQLLGQGDMLYMSHGGRIARVHGPFVSEREVERVTQFLRRQGVPEYDESVTREPEGEDSGVVEGDDGGDDLYARAKRVVVESGRVSTSYLQRRLGVGYNRAANLVERMEADGFVSAPNPSGRREVLG